MTPAIRETVLACLQAILRDEPWQDFGFRKRPRRGAFFQKFRPAWKVSLEKKLLQEMLSILTAAHVASGMISRGEVDECVDAYTATPTLAGALGYPSKDEARVLIVASTARYIEVPPDQWAGVLHSQIALDTVLDKAVAARLFLGCAQFGMTAQRMVAVLRSRNT